MVLQGLLAFAFLWPSAHLAPTILRQHVAGVGLCHGCGPGTPPLAGEVSLEAWTPGPLPLCLLPCRP